MSGAGKRPPREPSPNHEAGTPALKGYRELSLHEATRLLGDHAVAVQVSFGPGQKNRPGRSTTTG